MSSLPTVPRPISATQYKKELLQKNGGEPLAPPEDAKQPTLLQSLAPPPDEGWKKDQMDFRAKQYATMQGVREAFVKQGHRTSMATIERALSVPNERTFAECMA